MSVRHVLMTADTVGGVWTYSLELARGLAREGVRVSLATMGASVSDSQRAEAQEIDGLTIYESTYKLEWMDDPWRDVDHAGEWLLSLERKLRPDVVHLNGYCHGSLPWPAPVVMVAHSCVMSWWEAVRKETAPGEWNEYRLRVQQGLRSANAVVAVSRHMASEIHRLYSLERAVETIYNGVASQNFHPTKKDDFVLSCGRMWDQAKNVAALSQAAELSLWPVLVAGDGASAETDRFRLLGKLPSEELREWYGRAGIYALPAKYEPFGLSVVEAALSGCALVLGDIPSLREIWGDAALYVPPDDHEALAIVLNILACRPEMREQLGRKARARAAMFTPERMVQSYLRLYSQAAAGTQVDSSELSCVS